MEIFLGTRGDCLQLDVIQKDTGWIQSKTAGLQLLPPPQCKDITGQGMLVFRCFFVLLCLILQI